MDMRGYYSKYIVTKRDTGEEVTEDTFTLVPARDPAALAAVLYYAKVARDINPELACDLEERFGKHSGGGAVPTSNQGISNQGEDFDLVRALVPVVRAADEEHQVEGGGTRHWLRDYFLPRLNAAGYVVKRQAR